MKLIRIFLVFVAVSFVVGVGSAFNGKNNPQTSQTSEEKISLSTNTVDEAPEDEQNSQEECKTETKPVENKKTSVIQNSKQEKVVEKETNNQQNNSSSVKKESNPQINTQKNIVVEQREEVKQEVYEQPKNDTVKQEIVVDAELERLKAQVEYATYDSCMEVGFEKSLEDTVGILGFSCQYIAYKGEVLGYKLILNYTNPMNN